MNEVCNDCEVELTSENTSNYGGFDGSNFLSARSVGVNVPRELFTKCDDCFDAQIDRYLDHLYE